MIKAQIIKDSINPDGQRLTTWVLQYPRFIHSEFMTHRAFSKNSASSRAIPVEKMMQSIKDEPALPEYWGATQKGMQAAGELTGESLQIVNHAWALAKQDCLKHSTTMLEAGLHKQLANRVTEAWAHMNVLATATDHRNFFSLRAHKDAQPEFQVLAFRMLHAYLNSKPEEVHFGNWHIPFTGQMTAEVDMNMSVMDRIKVATARCARVSYRNFEGRIEIMKDIELHNKLMESGHMSPFEHCAMAVRNQVFLDCGNFKTGWQQYRKLIPGENRTNVDLQAILAAKPDWISLQPDHHLNPETP